MDGSRVSTGRLLKSVALCYRQPIGAPRPLRSAGGGICRHFLLDQSEEEPPGGHGPHVRSASLARLEAVLFLAGEPQGSRKLAELAALADGTKARTLVRALNRLYDAEGSAFRVEEVAGGFRLMTRAKFAPWLRRLHQTPVEVRLSTPAMETLAVVAYRQPVLRAEIEAIRGVQCGELLRQLIERDLVRIAGRSEELGRPFLYGTTRRFLEVFGLRHLDELPRSEWMGPSRHDPAAADSAVEEDMLKQANHGHESEEETEVSILTTKSETPEESTPAMISPEFDETDDDDFFFEDDEDEFDDEDDFDDYDEDEDLDDEDIEDEPWEEVGDDEEEDDEDWDEDEDWGEDDWEED